MRHATTEPARIGWLALLPLLAAGAALLVGCGGDLSRMSTPEANADAEAETEAETNAEPGDTEAEAEGGDAEAGDAGGQPGTEMVPTTPAAAAEPVDGLLLQEAAEPIPTNLHTEIITYEHDGTVLEGFVAYDPSMEGQRPGVLIVHQWRGLGDYEQRRAQQLAALGYVAFAADIYGQGVRPANATEAREAVSGFYADRGLLRARVAAGLERLRAFEMTDPERTAAIGYCFGGTAVVELALSGADVDGVVSFHGGLSFDSPDDFANIRGHVLIAHGAEDPAANLDALWETIGHLRAHHVTWRLALYSHAVHSFTHAEAGNDPSQGSAYDARADRHSWHDMQLFFDELWPATPR